MEVKECLFCKQVIKRDKWNRLRKTFCSHTCQGNWWSKTEEGKVAWRKSQSVNIPLLKSRVGKLNPAYKGLKRKTIVHSNGYKLIPIEDHPFSKKNRPTQTGMILEHRLVMERHLQQTNLGHPALIDVGGSKYLSRDWVVHHINGVRSDNRIENLELYYQKHHTGHSIICINCGKDALKKAA